MSYRRYAIYDLPENAQLSTTGASWLGWDAVTGQSVAHPDLSGIAEVTDTPRKYGFHATLKPPFRLADGIDENSLREGVAVLASATAPVVNDGLKISAIGKFLALTPTGNTSAIDQLAFKCVRSLERFRAPLNESELARRRKAALTPRQEELLQHWGYPYVDDEFNYHITLTGKLDANTLQRWHETASGYFQLASPYRIGSLALAGECEHGGFELVERFPLTGRADYTD